MNYPVRTMTKADRVHLRLTHEQKDAWFDAAERDGFVEWREDIQVVNLSDWLRSLADKRVKTLRKRVD